MNYSQELALITWRDGIEILILSFLFYYVLRWFASDKQSKVLEFFLGYAVLGFGAYLIELQVFLFLYVLSLPIVGVFAIMMHQQTLQKAFVIGKQYTAVKPLVTDWLHELMRACLNALNMNKEIICIIERSHPLTTFLSSSGVFNAELKAYLVDNLMVRSSDEPMTLWMNSKGILVAVDVAWDLDEYEEWVSDTIKVAHKWKQDALFITSKTDALVVKISCKDRSFDLIVDGTSIAPLTAGDCFTLLKRYISGQSTKEVMYAYPTRDNTTRETVS